MTATYETSYELTANESITLAKVIDKAKQDYYHIPAVEAYFLNDTSMDVDDCLERFEEAYAGEWDTFREFAEQLAEDIGMTEGAGNYFDYDAWARDLIHDYDALATSAGTVFIYLSSF
jgi:antirestriction protein